MLACTTRLCAAPQGVHVLQDGSPDVRQSAFALAGDLAKCCLPQLASVYSRLVELCVHSLHPSLITLESMSASNNACWALGEWRLPCWGSDEQCKASCA